MKKMRQVLAFLLIFVMGSFVMPFIFHYVKYQATDYYMFEKEQLQFSDIFYHMDNNSNEMYGIGLFDCFDSYELQESPDLIQYYDEMEIRIFDAKTITDLFELLRECTFSEVNKNEAYELICALKDKNAITSIHLSTDALFVGNPWFSKDFFNSVNNQIVGVVDSTIYSFNGEGYLVANMATFLEYNEFREYELPSFAETSLAVFKIENSYAFDELVQRKNDFYVYEPDFYVNRPIKSTNILFGFLFVAVYVFLQVKKERKNTIIKT